jgi:hypothetical protein
MPPWGGFMTKKILLAAMVGGVALFFWGFVSHMLTPLGTTGIQTLPQEQAVMDSLKASVPHSGLYFFPGMQAGQTLPPEQVGGPWGIMVFHPTGATTLMTGQLVNEFILNVVQALIAAYLLSLIPGLTGYISRVGFVFALGVFGALATNVEYWNWYGFPLTYTIATIADDVIGFLVVGLVVAAFVKPRAEPARLAVPRAA